MKHEVKVWMNFSFSSSTKGEPTYRKQFMRTMQETKLILSLLANFQIFSLFPIETRSTHLWKSCWELWRNFTLKTPYLVSSALLLITSPSIAIINAWYLITLKERKFIHNCSNRCIRRMYIIWFYIGLWFSVIRNILKTL